MMMSRSTCWLPGVVCVLMVQSLMAQTLPKELEALDADVLFAAAQRDGNAVRGAILFHGPLMGCGKCHSVRDGADLLGPNLAQPPTIRTGRHLVESILMPSAVVDPKYQAVQVLTDSGNVFSGMLTKESLNEVVLRSPDTLQDARIARDEIAVIKPSETSLMPHGLVAALANEAEFLDLVKYVIEIREGGTERARQLQPTAAQLAIQLPEYEANIDHAGFIEEWSDESYARGEAIYMGLCVNCHGTLDAPGSLATALRFGEGKFKFGTDPYAMYQTLTRGAGLMLPQPWMVPQQKYDVIHYLREHFLRPNSEATLASVTSNYLAGLPRGSERGPEPKVIEPWSQADYGPRMIGTFEIGSGGRNIAQKGIALQLDHSPGGVAQGEAWVIFDHDTLRAAGVWTSRGFIDWQGINFNGRHGMHPHVVGDVMLANPTGPGWANPTSGSLADDARVLGRDGRWYGPLPRAWGQYRGLYSIGSQSVIAYSIGHTQVHEAFRWSPRRLTTGLEAEESHFSNGIFLRQLDVGPRPDALQVVVATLDDGAAWRVDGDLAMAATNATTSQFQPTQFQGEHYLQIDGDEQLDLSHSDFTIRARASVSGDGTIVSVAPRDGPWAPGGQTLFLRDGKLSYDVGWVGVIQAKERIDDGQAHDLALTFKSSSGLVSLWIDGERIAKKKLRPKKPLADPVLRIGHTAPDFPRPSTLRDASIDRVQCFQRELTETELLNWDVQEGLAADWDLRRTPPQSAQTTSHCVSDGSGNGRNAALVRSQNRLADPLWAGFEAPGDAASFIVRGEQLLLNIAAGAEPVQLSIWNSNASPSISPASLRQLARLAVGAGRTESLSLDPEDPLLPEEVKTRATLGHAEGGFAVDDLQVPKVNPWNARLRLTGFDFFEDPDRMAVCTWDGDVWLVSGLSQLQEPESELQWRRIAFGLFQPLGLKIIDETIYLTCRDQLVRLDDRNQDGEIDYYHCVNNDHQVTEHFHEFAMGLQTDAAGNFYYAKSARHALTAVVPHHGTLLRVSPDGRATEILARGFRAANGVCLNPDGTFIVTDQEGHWNPKNRINYVKPGGFYGNMYGYHDVTDESDSAMEQPLCWITNAFDRSPAELLWCDSPAWGPLDGQLFNLSYGYGKVFVVPHEKIGGQAQGGMCELPIADFPTGIIRGRFSPHDGQLYVCGLSAWASSQTAEEGGLYRIRYTGEAAALPVELTARRNEMRIVFSEPLSSETSLLPDHYTVRTWSLKRTKEYGSEHNDERELVIERVVLSPDRSELRLVVPELQPTWCMEIELPIVSADGRRVVRVIHNTVHQLGAGELGVGSRRP